MPIRKTYGSKTAVEAGKLIGEAKAGEKEQARKERLADKAMAYKNQRAMAQFNAEMQMQRQKMAVMIDLQAEQRARQWEVDKMELRSRNDFLAEERERTKRIQEFQQGLSEIEKAEQQQKYPTYILQQAKTDLASRYYDVPQAAPYLGIGEYLKAQQRNKPLTLPQQKSNIEAAMELEGYTPEDLVQLGLNPQQFPNVGGTTAVTITSDEEYNALPSGTLFIGPDGKQRRKP